MRRLARSRIARGRQQASRECRRFVCVYERWKGPARVGGIWRRDHRKILTLLPALLGLLAAACSGDAPTSPVIPTAPEPRPNRAPALPELVVGGEAGPNLVPSEVRRRT